MSIRINNQNVVSVKLNGHKVIEGKLNGQTLFKFEGTPYTSFRMRTSSSSVCKVPFTLGEYGNNLTNVTILWGDGESTVITDGSITENIIKHTYTSEGEYDIFIYSYNSKIPKLMFSSYSGGDNPALLKINNPILPMINADGSNFGENLFNQFFFESSLEYVPEDVFSLNSYATQFSQTFRGCSLEEIPQNLFKYNVGASNFSYCFYGCNSVTSIPENLFRYTTASSVDLSFCFTNTGIVSIPNNLFSYLGTRLSNINSIFKLCTSLNSISSNIFSTNTTLTSFSEVFNSTGLSSIPQGLFDNNILSNDFRFCFNGCTSLESIPEYLFRVPFSSSSLNFRFCFANCPKLQLSQNIFCDEETEMDTVFKNKTLDFTSCFLRDSFSGEKGVSPQLWNYTYGSVTSLDCFLGSGNSWDSLYNYYIIPEEWGGPYKANSMAFIIDTTKVSSTNKAFVMPFREGTYADIGTLTIDWGDGLSTSIPNKVINSSNMTHNYSNTGEYAITVSSSNGNIPYFGYHYSNDKNNQIQITRFETPFLHMYDSRLVYGELVNNVDCFDDCSNLEYFYEDLFSNNLQIKQMGALFRNCIKIKEIPENLFSKLTNLVSFSYTFAYSGIESVPENLFKYNINIGEDLYSNGFYKTFANCVFLISVPENLFKYNISSKSFSSCFSFCSSLRNIYQNLFKYNTNVTDFSHCFDNCEALESVPEYLFRYNLKANNFEGTFYNCGNLSLNKNIFCDEETEMATRFSSGDIIVEENPLQNNLSFYETFYSVSKGEAPSLWDYTYNIQVISGETTKVLDYPLSLDCFRISFGTFSNEITNYPLIPQIWGGEYVPNTMTFTIDTGELSSGNTQFVLPFSTGSYTGLGSITIDWGDTTYDERAIVVGDNLSNSEIALNFPDNLSSSLSSYSNNSFINCGSDVTFSTYYSSDIPYGGTYWEALVSGETSSKTLILEPGRGILYSASSDSSAVVKYSLAKVGYTKGGLLVTSIDTSNPAYQCMKLKVPNNQTKITSGVITEELCTHNYSNPGVYKVTITSSNNKIPKFTSSSVYGSRLITSIKDTLLQMIDENNNNITDFNYIFSSSKIKSIPSSLFYFNREITNFFNFMGGSLLENIPVGLFNYTKNIITVSNAFSSCPITSIPNNLFYNNTFLENVSSCFTNCSSLESIPSNIFAYNKKITDFSNCFSGCTSLGSIGENLFYLEGEGNTRFLNKKISFSSCFNGSGSFTNTLTLPELWNCLYYLVDSYDCFSNFRGSPTNMSSVPYEWGGPYIALKINIDTTKDVNNPSTFIIPFKVGTYSNIGSIIVDWGDSTTTTFENEVTLNLCTHTYSVGGSYTVTIRDSANSENTYMPNFSFANTSTSNAIKIISTVGTMCKMINSDGTIPEFDYMFENCSNLKYLTSGLLLLNTDSTTAISMFRSSGVVGLPYSFFQTNNILDFSACFYACTSLVDLPIMRSGDNYNNCFNGCISLKTVPFTIFNLPPA